MAIAILCGSHRVAWDFTRYMMEDFSIHIAFVEVQTHSNILAQVSANERVRLSQYESEDHTVRKIKELGVTTVVLAWWPSIVHKLTKLGINVINTHPSYLPFNRGKHPYYWAIVEKTPFGATIHRVDDGVDTGAILWRKQVMLSPEDTGETAYNKAAIAMKELLLEHAEDIALENFPIGIKQDEKLASFHLAKQLEAPPITSKTEIAFLNDLRARSFDNRHSGRQVIIDGVKYRVYVKLTEDKA